MADSAELRRRRSCRRPGLAPRALCRKRRASWPALGRAVLGLLAPRAGGAGCSISACGDGVLTEAIVRRRGAGGRCRRRAGDGRGGGARGADWTPGSHGLGRALDFRRGSSRRSSPTRRLHWMTDHAAVARGVPGRLVPGGRFVGEFGGHGQGRRHPHSTSRPCCAAGTPTRWRSTPGPSRPTGNGRRRWTEAGFRTPTLWKTVRPADAVGDRHGGMARHLCRTVPQRPAGGGSRGRPGTEVAAVDLLRPALCDRSGHWIAPTTRGSGSWRWSPRSGRRKQDSPRGDLASQGRRMVPTTRSPAVRCGLLHRQGARPAALSVRNQLQGAADPL